RSISPASVKRLSSLSAPEYQRVTTNCSEAERACGRGEKGSEIMQRVRKHSIVWLAILSLQVVAINLAPPGTKAARLPDILLRGRSLASNALLPILRSAGLS